jgi:energy-coupling factor transporter ATP-binding protein EcfA2
VDLTQTPGLWISIDGPGGTGKSTTAHALADLLTVAGHRVHLTQQPFRTDFGTYVRHAIRTSEGYPLACLITADRYWHVHNEIRPALGSNHRRHPHRPGKRRLQEDRLSRSAQQVGGAEREHDA